VVKEMRNSSDLLTVVLALILLVCTGFGGQNKSSDVTIRPFDDTEKWAMPYDAEAEKIKRIHDGIPAIKPHMTYPEAVAKLGAPDAVYDLREAFFGLSPQEDGFLMRYRSDFSFRVVWYLSKHGTSPNLNDKWFALYIATDEKTLLARLANKIELPKVE
jgi:hypothetical protein